MELRFSCAFCLSAQETCLKFQLDLLLLTVQSQKNTSCYLQRLCKLKVFSSPVLKQGILKKCMQQLQCNIAPEWKVGLWSTLHVQEHAACASTGASTCTFKKELPLLEKLPLNVEGFQNFLSGSKTVQTAVFRKEFLEKKM